jgi:hypothetical protein
VVHDRRSGKHEVLPAVDLAVEDAERILPESRAAILVQLIEVRLEIADQLLAVRRAALRIPDRVQAQRVGPEPSFPSEPLAQRQDLDVGLGTADADDLDPELAELAEAPPPAACRVGSDAPRSTP